MNGSSILKCSTLVWKSITVIHITYDLHVQSHVCLSMFPFFPTSTIRPYIHNSSPSFQSKTSSVGATMSSSAPLYTLLYTPQWCQGILPLPILIIAPPRATNSLFVASQVIICKISACLVTEHRKLFLTVAHTTLHLKLLGNVSPFHDWMCSWSDSIFTILPVIRVDASLRERLQTQLLLLKRYLFFW